MQMAKSIQAETGISLRSEKDMDSSAVEDFRLMRSAPAHQSMKASAKQNPRAKAQVKVPNQTANGTPRCVAKVGVTKKLTEDPMREKLSTKPKARASTFPSNQR